MAKEASACDGPEMKSPIVVALFGTLAACAGGPGPLNTDYAVPQSPEIARSLALRDRYNLPKHLGETAIVVDTVSGHHIRFEASTIVWKDKAGKWQWSQVSETVPGGLLPTERKLASNDSRTLTDHEAATLDRLVATPNLYRETKKTIEARGIGAPFHVMSIVTPFGRTTISWDGRLIGTSGAVADIVLGKG